MNHLQVAVDQSNAIDNCRSVIVFLRETMCCGEVGTPLDLGPLALSGLGYIYQLLEDQLEEVSNTSIEVVRSLIEISGKDSTKAAA